MAQKKVYPVFVVWICNPGRRTRRRTKVSINSLPLLCWIGVLFLFLLLLIVFLFSTRAFNEVLLKYPYPRFHLFSGGLHYDDYFSKFDFHNINQKFKLLSVAEGRIKYLDNKHKQK